MKQNFLAHITDQDQESIEDIRFKFKGTVLLVCKDQKGFVKGRYIGECIRTTYDIIEYAKTNNRTGMLLLIDF